MCGLDIAPSSYLGVAVGGGGGAATPDYSVALFADLPADATVGQRVAVTGESGLSGVVCVNTAANTWELETVTATYDLIAAVEWGATPGQWYSSGGITVSTAAAAVVVDTTNQTTWLWDATNTQFVPPMVYRGTIAGVQKIKGDSAAPSGWTVVDTDGGGTASITTAGGKVTLSASTSAIASTTAALTYTDAGITASANVYFRGMIKATLSARQGLVRISVSNNANAVDFGSGIVAGVATATGKYLNAALTAPYTQQATVTLDWASAETLVEILQKQTRTSVRVGGGIWHDLATTDARAVGISQIAILCNCNPDTATASLASLEVRHVASMRF